MGMRRTLCLLSLTVALGAFGYEKCVVMAMTFMPSVAGT